jgi:hypothetical protein
LTSTSRYSTSGFPKAVCNQSCGITLFQRFEGRRFRKKIILYGKNLRNSYTQLEPFFLDKSKMTPQIQKGPLPDLLAGPPRILAKAV